MLAKNKRKRLRMFVTFILTMLLSLNPVITPVTAQQSGGNTATTLWDTSGEIDNKQVNAKNCLGAFCGPTIVLALTVNKFVTMGQTSTTSSSNSSNSYMVDVITVFTVIINFILLAASIYLAYKVMKKLDREEDYFVPILVFLIFWLIIFLVDRWAAGLFGLI